MEKNDANEFLEAMNQITRTICYSIKESTNLSEEDFNKIKNSIYSTLCITLYSKRGDSEKLTTNFMYWLMDEWKEPDFIFKDDFCINILEIAYSRELWMTNEGKLIPINEMATKHLVNSLKCLDGNGNQVINTYPDSLKAKWRERIKNELKARNKVK